MEIMEENSEKIWNLWKKEKSPFNLLFFCIFYIFSVFKLYFFDIPLAFLPYFQYHFTIFFCIFQIFSLFNLLIGKIWKKDMLNSEKIWKIQKKIVKRYEKYGRKAS
jgi:hypothetical protein